MIRKGERQRFGREKDNDSEGRKTTVRKERMSVLQNISVPT